jgi:hypothetical protein
MRNAKLYRQYAAECRRIAQTMSPDQKARLLEIAEAWDACARDAEKEQGSDEEDPAQPMGGQPGRSGPPHPARGNARLRAGVISSGNRRRAGPAEQSQDLTCGGQRHFTRAKKDGGVSVQRHAGPEGASKQQGAQLQKRARP